MEFLKTLTKLDHPLVKRMAKDLLELNLFSEEKAKLLSHLATELNDTFNSSDPNIITRTKLTIFGLLIIQILHNQASILRSDDDDKIDHTNMLIEQFFNEDHQKIKQLVKDLSERLAAYVAMDAHPRMWRNDCIDLVLKANDLMRIGKI